MNKIVYDDKMIDDMLDRNKVAEEEKAVAYNDYLQVCTLVQMRRRRGRRRRRRGRRRKVNCCYDDRGN